MDKGTIVYIGGFELPDKNAAAHRVLSNSKILNNLGYKIVFIGVNKDLPKSNLFSPKKGNFNNYELWEFSYPKTKSQWIRYLVESKSKIEILDSYSNIKAVVLYNYQSIPFSKILKYCKTKNIKVIADCTEWYGITSGGIIRNVFKYFDTYGRMKVLHKKVDGLIAISTYLQKYYENKTETILIPPLVDKSEIKWVKEDFPITQDKINLVYAGSPAANKDKIDYVISALYNLRGNAYEYSFTVIGLDEKTFINTYPEVESKYKKIKKNINFLGRLSHQESLKYVKNADYTIFIRDFSRSTKAGFPTKFVESISAGTPIITTDTSDLSNYMNHGYNGIIVKSVNLNEIESSLKTIFQKSFFEIRKSKKQVQADLFDISNYEKNIEVFLENVLSV